MNKKEIIVDHTRIKKLRKNYKELLLSCAAVLNSYKYIISKNSDGSVSEFEQIIPVIEELDSVFMEQTKTDNAAHILNTAVIGIENA